MDTFTAQIRQILRRLKRAPLFTAVTLITLAAGVGANIAVFSVLEGVILKPLPYAHPNNLVSVALVPLGLDPSLRAMAPAFYFTMRDQTRAFEDIGLYDTNGATVTGIGQPEQVQMLETTDGTLPILGVRPALGRLFTRRDNSSPDTRTVLLTYAYWQRHFGGQPSAIGKSLILDGQATQIIGVLPKDFRFFDQPDLSLVLPMYFDRAKTYLGNFSFSGVARLKPGMTLAQASADVARMIPITLDTFPAPPGFSLELFTKARLTPSLRPLKDDVVGNVSTLLWILMASLGMVLLIACANVANLFLVRAEGRQQELAIRAALGASRGRIAGEMLLESLIIGLIGSAFGLGLAYAAIKFLVALAPSGLPRLQDIGIDGNVLLFTLGIAIVTSLLFGSVPVLKYAGVHINMGLRGGGRTLSESRERHRARSVLVVVQVALALVLLICSGLMIRTFAALMHVNPGFTQASTVQTFRIFIPKSDVSNDEGVLRAEQQIQEKLAAIPGVSSVAFSIGVPMSGQQWMDPLFAADHSYAAGQLPPLRRHVMISPEYFSTLGIPLIAGRTFTWTKVNEKAPVVIVSENLARSLWGNPANALGKQIRIGSQDDWRQIIGVVGDVHDFGMNQPSPTMVYWPPLLVKFEDDPIRVARAVTFSLRTPRAGSRSLMDEARRAVWSVDANLPLASVHTLDYYYSNSMARTSFTLIMLGIAGGMALLLGAVGLYGVIAYSVSQRTREIGIRMALGAQRGELIRMFVRHGLLLTGIGTLCGLAVAFAATRLMASLLFHTSPADPLTYAAAIGGLVFAAFCASYLPSRRAASVDPVEALRAE